MSPAPRAKLGGIHTLQDLRGRCVIDPDTGCWHLRKADGKRWLHKPRAVPVINTVIDGKHVHVSARKWAWTQLHGQPPADHVVTYVCRSWDCANPAHQRCLPTEKHTALMVAKGAYRSVAKTKAARITSRTRANVRLSEELAQWARESDQTQAAIAHGLGVSQQRISDILRGKVWRPQMANASVFVFSHGTAGYERRAA